MPQETYQLPIPPHIPAIMKISCTLQKKQNLKYQGKLQNFKTSKRVKTLTKFNIVVISILW